MGENFWLLIFIGSTISGDYKSKIHSKKGLNRVKNVGLVGGVGVKTSFFDPFWHFLAKPSKMTVKINVSISPQNLMKKKLGVSQNLSEPQIVFTIISGAYKSNCNNKKTSNKCICFIITGIYFTKILFYIFLNFFIIL